MTKDELKIKVEECFKSSEKILNDSGSLIPMLDIEFIDSNDKKNIIAVGLALPDDNKVKRDLFIKGLGLSLGAIQRIGKIKTVSCVVMMSEAWASTVVSDEDYKAGKFVMPSQDPNRREMLIVTGLTKDRICISRFKEMISVEVKGKRHFSLQEPEAKEEQDGTESNLLNNFFCGYDKALEDNESNRKRDAMGNFEDLSLEELLQSAIKVLSQHVGGIDSELINYKK